MKNLIKNKFIETYLIVSPRYHPTNNQPPHCSNYKDIETKIGFLIILV